MCTNSRTRTAARCMAVLFGVAIALAAAPALANPGAGVAIAPDFPPTTFPGDMFTGHLTIYNTSDPDVPVLTVNQIQLNASCGDRNEPCTLPNGEVFVLGAVGIGSQACAGVTFAVVEQEPDLYFFIPNMEVNLTRIGAGGTPCVISYDVTTIGVPTIDGAPGVEGIQTYQVAYIEAEGFSDIVGDNEEATGLGTDTIQVLFNPEIDVTKDCDDVVGPDAEITFSGTITNIGNIPLFNVTLTDSHAGPIVLVDTELAVGESVAYSGSYLPPNGDPTLNVVTATGDYDVGGLTDTVMDTADDMCEQLIPDVMIVKDCLPRDLGTDSNIIDITVTNTGEVELTGCVVADPLAGYTSDPFTLAVGASADFDTAVSSIMEDTANTATVTCDVTGAAFTVEDIFEDICEVPICEVWVDKQISCDGGMTWSDVGYDDDVIDACDVVAGDIVQVRYLASSGDSTGALVGCTLTDSNLGILPEPQSVPDLAMGFNGQILTTSILECTDVLEAGEPDTATLQCECFDATTDFFVSDTDQAAFACLQPELEVVKDCIEQPLDSDFSDIEITVTNMGEVAFENCVATDTLAGYTSDPFNLAIGASNVLSTTVALDVETLNEVSVTCDVVGSDQTVTEIAEDICEVPICEVWVDKQISCDGGMTWIDMGYDDDMAASCDVVGGENVWVRYLASAGASTGDLVNCTLNETNLGIFAEDQTVGTLAMGFDGPILTTQMLECTEDLELGEPDTATLTCECFDDTTDFFVSDSDQAAFVCQQADFTVAKTCVPEWYANLDSGFVDVVEITVENTGEVALECSLVDTLYLDDDMCPPVGDGSELFTLDFSIDVGVTMMFDSDTYPALGTAELTADACNQVVVECTPVGAAEALPPETAYDVCEFVDCQVALDKQISCDGGLNWVDVGVDDDVADACIGWTAYDGQPGSEVLVRYVASNIGNVDLNECTITESNGLLYGGMVGPFGLAVGAMDWEWELEQGPECSMDLSAGEPDTAMINCLCAGYGMDAVVMDDDSADFECQTPALQVAKICDEEMDDMNQVTITVSNVGDFDLANCTVVDTIYLDDPTCPADMGDGTPVEEFLIGYLSAGDSTQLQTMWTDLMNDACNTVMVECDIVGAGGATITATADDVCEAAAGCLTRTPGFWKTHPHITDLYLPLETCSLVLDNTYAGVNGSAIEDMCVSGRDAKANDTTMQQLQLIRQCTAAQLNIAASAELEGNCYAEYPGLGDQIEYCCGELCTGASCGDIAASGCIEWLDAFNNSYDSLDSYGTPFESPGPAQPGECREANGNGFVNDRDLCDASGGNGGNNGNGNAFGGPRLERDKK